MDLEAGLRGSQRSLHSLASQENLSEEERQQLPPHSDDLQYDILSCEDDHLAAPLQVCIYCIYSRALSQYLYVQEHRSSPASLEH